MIDVTIDLEVLSDTPVSVGAGGSTGTLADKVIVRDSRGRPLIPGSQVKGRTRHAAEAIASTLGLGVPQSFGDETDTIIRRVFGSPQQRAPLHFASLIADVGKAQTVPQWLSQIRPSVALNQRRGTAEDERLLFQETALRGMRFTARPAIVGTLPDLGHVALLWAALRVVDCWGSAKSRGLGWAAMDVRVTVDGQAQDAAVLAEALRDLVRWGGA
ncbi:RAMP superfamily CRISPR-associated protein [Roseiflexus castenholzii]|uniref:RAMP superfamily CRISPR-associated protein n=1 Tax=Roseiflexus castenholzii TaxID=120962 RepID=UPI003C7A37C3